MVAHTSKKRRIVFTVVGIIAAFIATIIVLTILSIFRYIDTHKWATIRVTGSTVSETADAYMQEYECLKGDQISIGNISLTITDVSTDGTVHFQVIDGEMKNSDGSLVNNDTLILKKKEYYQTDNGTIQLEVISNRYQ